MLRTHLGSDDPQRLPMESAPLVVELRENVHHRHIRCQLPGVQPRQVRALPAPTETLNSLRSF